MNTRYIPPPSDLPPGSPVDAYLRDSGGEGQYRSVGSQLAELKLYCDHYKLILRRVYKDAARSGKSVAGREDFDRMLGDYERGADNPAGLILWDYARFARNAREAVFNIALIENTGIVIHSLTDNIPDGEYKDLVRLVKHMGNQAEREKNSAAVKRELHQLVRVNRAMFGVPPRGFTREALPPVRNERTGELRTLHKWVPDPTSAPLVLRAYQMRERGASIEEISRATGLYKNVNCYTSFWPNKLYKGVLEFGGMTIDDYCDPIVPPDLWERVQVLRRQSVPGNGARDPRRARSVYILSGLIHCAKCGAPLTGHYIKDWRYYICSRRKASNQCNARHVPKEKIENAVLHSLEERALAFENLLRWKTMLERELANAESDVERARISLDRELAAAKKQIAYLTRAIAAHGHSDSMLAALRSAENQVIEIEYQIKGLENTVSIPRIETVELKRIAAHISRILTAGADAEKRDLVRSIVTHITARRDDTAIYSTVKYLPLQILKHPAERSDLGQVLVPPRGTWVEDEIEIIIPVRKYSVGVK